MTNVPKIHTLTTALAYLLLAGLGAGCSTVQQAVCPSPSAQPAAEQADGLDAPVANCDCSKKEESATAESSEAQEQREPRAITSEQITFESKGDELAGVVDRPQEIGEPLPAVVVLHDSGPMDRNGLSRGALGLELPVEVAVYQELAENLAQNGYVVIRFDKRTCVEGGPPWCKYPREYIKDHREKLASVLMADARAAVDLLRKRKDVDPTRVFLLGHGQGAEIALALSPDVESRGLVLLAPSPYPVDDVILHQTSASLTHLEKRRKAEGNTTMGTLLQQQLDALEATHKEQKQAFEKLRADELDEDDVLGAPKTTWSSLFELHDRAMASLKNSQTPVLALFGEHDLNLPHDSHETVQAKLDRSSKSEVMLLPGVTHPMVGLDEEDSDTTQVSEDVHQAILHFLNQVASKPQNSSPDS